MIEVSDQDTMRSIRPETQNGDWNVLSESVERFFAGVFARSTPARSTAPGTVGDLPPCELRVVIF